MVGGREQSHPPHPSGLQWGLGAWRRAGWQSPACPFQRAWRGPICLHHLFSTRWLGSFSVPGPGEGHVAVGGTLFLLPGAPGHEGGGQTLGSGREQWRPRGGGLQAGGKAGRRKTLSESWLQSSGQGEALQVQGSPRLDLPGDNPASSTSQVVLGLSPCCSGV